MTRQKLIYNNEFPNGKLIDFTAEEETQRDITEAESKVKIQEAQNKRDKKETDKASANQKLKDLGLTDDEIKAITK